MTNGFDLAAARLNRGLTLRRAALLAGVHHDALRRAEMGRRPHPAPAKLIADFYGVAVTDIWPVPPRKQAAA